MSIETKCPLCRSSASIKRRKIEVSLLVEEWKRCFSIDAQPEFHGISEIQEHLCTVCGLIFFKPESAAGSSTLYEALEKFDWYYLPRKWEHDMAIQDMALCKNGIEIGCGFGDFVERVVRELNVEFEGCEQNQSAVDIMRQKGRRVYLDTIENLATTHANAYDAACSFQVLEHVSQPGSFLEAACAILRPGGKLMLGLPNSASFIRHQFNVLDMPPHHMTRWTKEVLVRLQRLFPLKLIHLANEPLQDYHLAGYVEAYARALSKWPIPVLSHPGVQSRLVRAIRYSGMQRFLRGQTIYACYTRV